MMTRLSRRIIRWLLLIILVGVVVILVNTIFVWWSIMPDDPGRRLLPGCQVAPRQLVLDVNRAEIMDVLIGSMSPCKDFGFEGEEAAPVRVGSRVKVQLVSRTFPGQVELLGAEIQILNKHQPWAQWTWEILADRPGEYAFSLIVSTVGQDGSSVEYQNFRSEVKVVVEATLGYTASSILHTLEGFFTSIAGILTSVGVVAAATGRVVLQRRRSSAGKQGLRSPPRSRLWRVRTPSTRRSLR